MKIYKTKVVGNYFCSVEAKQILKEMGTDGLLILTPETDNEHDKYATKVQTIHENELIKLGYIPAELSQEIQTLLLQGGEYRCSYLGKYNIKVEIKDDVSESFSAKEQEKEESVYRVYTIEDYPMYPVFDGLG